MKKFICFLIIYSTLCAVCIAQNVGIGIAVPDASAKLDVTSTNSGLLPPRMSATQRDAIPSPAAGLIIYNSTSNAIEFYNGTAWYSISNSISNEISNAIFANSPVNKLTGGYSSEKINSFKKTSDGGYIWAGNTNSSNTGALSGITSNGGFDYWVVKVDGGGNVKWQKLLGGSGYEEASSVQQTADGGFIVVGHSASSNTGTLTGLVSNGSYDCWIMKLDGNGNIQWQKLLGGGANDYGNDVLQTADGGYIVAGNATSSNTGTLTGVIANGGGDGWIIKLNGNGTTQWQKLIGGSSYESMVSIQQTADAGYILAGTSQSSNTGTLAGVITNGGNDLWILKTDGAGILQWQKLLGGTGYDMCNSVKQTTDGGYILAAFSGSSNTGTLTGFISKGLYDYWIVKLNATGVLQWQQLMGGTQDEYAYEILQTADGGYFVAGHSGSADIGGNLAGVVSNGDVDYWVLKLSGTGTMQWQKLLGGSLADLATSCVQNPDGGYVVAGYSNSSNSGTLSGKTGNHSNDGWLIKLDPFGNPL